EPPGDGPPRPDRTRGTVGAAAAPRRPTPLDADRGGGLLPGDVRDRERTEGGREGGPRATRTRRGPHQGDGDRGDALPRGRRRGSDAVRPGGAPRRGRE